MVNNFITFIVRYYIYFGSFLFLISLKSKRIETIFETKNKNMIPNHILKKGSKKNLNDFLDIIQKLLNKKKYLINTLKQTLSIGK